MNEVSADAVIRQLLEQIAALSLELAKTQAALGQAREQLADPAREATR